MSTAKHPCAKIRAVLAAIQPTELDHVYQETEAAIRSVAAGLSHEKLNDLANVLENMLPHHIGGREPSQAERVDSHRAIQSALYDLHQEDPTSDYLFASRHIRTLLAHGLSTDQLEALAALLTRYLKP
jgi:hypothetical protein